MVYIPPDEYGKPMLQQALFFQETLGMRVFICYIVEKPPFLKRLFYTEEKPNINIYTYEKFQAFTKNAVPSEVIDHFSFRIKKGKRIPVLIRQSNKGGYEFMIVDKSAAESSLKTNELDKIISHSFCPVMAVNINYPIKKINKIVIPVDVTQSTKKKLLWATYFAKKYGAKISIVSALTLNIDIKKSLVWKNSENLKSMLSQRGVECEVQVINAPGQEKSKVILNFIRDEDPDMVIIRTHQESNLFNTRIGKFVSELVHNCKIPVFTVNSYIKATPDDYELIL